MSFALSSLLSPLRSSLLPLKKGVFKKVNPRFFNVRALGALVLALVAWAALPVMSLTGGTSLTQAASTLSASDWKRLNAGAVVITRAAQASADNAGEVQAVFLVNRPIEQVYTVIRDTEALFAGDKTFQRTKVVSRPSPDTEVVDYSLKFSPVLPPLQYTNQIKFIKNKSSVFKRVKGSFKKMNGSLELAQGPRADQTLATYTLALQLDLPIPQPIVNHFLGSELPRSLGQIKNKVYHKYPG